MSDWVIEVSLLSALLKPRIRIAMHVVVGFELWRWYFHRSTTVLSDPIKNRRRRCFTLTNERTNVCKICNQINKQTNKDISIFYLHQQMLLYKTGNCRRLHSMPEWPLDDKAVLWRHTYNRRWNRESLASGLREGDSRNSDNLDRKQDTEGRRQMPYRHRSFRNKRSRSSVNGSS